MGARHVSEHVMGPIVTDRLAWSASGNFWVWHFSAKCSCGEEIACYGNRGSDVAYLRYHHEHHADEVDAS